MNLTIVLPDEEKCLLKNNQKVDFDTPFVEVKKELNKEIMLADKLKIPPHKIFNFLKKFVGDKVNKDEVIAFKKGLFSDNKYVSEYQGIITEVDHEKGKITLKIQDSKDIVKNCFFKGEVKEIKKNTILLEIKNKEEFSLTKAPVLTGGELIYLDQITNETSNELERKIIVIESITEINLSKVEVLGAKGIVTLMKVPEKGSSLPFFQIKNPQDFLKINKLKFPYCITDCNSSKIILYQ